MEISPEHCYEALKSRDPRFDGRFFVGVSTTGIYCRPICPARTPRPERCTFFAHAALAERQGYRPCLRCRPELAPGLARVDASRNAAHWVYSKIESGALNHGRIDDLAADYGLSARQLRRAVLAEFGVTPVQLAQTRRLLLAKQLLTETQLSMTRIALASGFSSVRRFNHLFQHRYGLNPSALRKHTMATGSDGLVLKLAYRPPLAWPELRNFLVARAAAGVEAAVGQRYIRTIRFEGCHGWMAVQALSGRDQLEVELSPELLPVLSRLLPRIRRLFDLDANPALIEGQLACDPRLRASLKKSPGLRVPGALDGFELALRAVLGQQVSVKAASTLFGRFATAFGEPAATPFGALRFFSPEAARIAAAPLQTLINLGLTRRRAQTVSDLARAVAAEELVLAPDSDLMETAKCLQSIAGIGPWTAQYVAMRALGDADALPASDLVLMKVLNVRKPAQLIEASAQWRPWRAYAALHLWNSLRAGG